MSFGSLFDGGRAISVVRRLLAWKQGDEDDTWAVKAVDALVKKLRTRKGAMEDLERALEAKHENTKCVTIARSQDGRLQVSHRKGLPHVIYCRVWRWADLQSPHELRALPTCLNPYENNANRDVCINPYHYQRVETPVLPPVLIPRHDQYNPNHVMAPFHPMLPDDSEQQMPRNFTFEEQHSPNLSMHRHLFSPMSSPGSPYSNYSHPSSPTQPFSPQSFPSSPPRNIMDERMDVGNEFLPGGDQEIVAKVELEETEMWCAIQYFEFNVRVGEPFNAPSHTGVHGIDVDGFTDPTINGKRFSLGMLSNISRNAGAESTRRHIGHGVRMHYIRGDVYAECLSTSSIFIQSQESNCRHGVNPTSIVKLTHKRSQKIFSSAAFARILQQRTCAQYPTPSYHNAYDAVFDMQKMCIIRLSFVKGWGSDYNRQDVISTPCWIEIRLHGPMCWLDKVLTQLPPPPIMLQSNT